MRVSQRVRGTEAESTFYLIHSRAPTVRRVLVQFYFTLFIVMVYNGFKCATTTKEKCATENGTFLIKLFSKIQLFLILTVCLALNSFPFGFIWFLHADTTLLFLLQLNYSLFQLIVILLGLSLSPPLSPSLPISLRSRRHSNVLCVLQCSLINANLLLY